MNGSREPGRASLTASPSRTNKSFASRDRNGFPLDARADADFPRQGRNRRVFTREREKRRTPNVTRRASPEKKKKTRPAWLVSAPIRLRHVAPHLARGVLGFWSRFERTPAIPSAPDVDDVRLSLHVHGQPRGVGRWPRCHRRAHGSRRGEQGRRRRKQRVLPRQGVRQDDDEVVARGCVPAHPADERETRNARRRDRARDATARSGRVASERAEARAPGSARRRRVGPRLFGPRVSGKSVASRPVAFSLSASLGFRSRRAHNHQSYPFSYAR